MSAAVHGDPELAADLRRRLGRKVSVAAAAVATADGARVAALGAGLDADFEIGSISKGVTGLLYADAIERGEVRPDTKLGDLLPLGDARAARITLSSLSVHRSGLPGLPGSAQPWRRTVALLRHGTNPYGETVERLIEQARGVRLRSRRPRYSNFGFELLGHALARAAGTAYPDLLRERVAEPLALDPWYIAAAPDDLRPGAIVGRNGRGRQQEPWTGEAIGPAGGIRASIDAMGRFTRALLDGTAPGLAALDSVKWFGPGARVGAAWMTMRHKGKDVIWHNGGTGGFRSWIGLDREAGLGVAVLAAVDKWVDGVGLALLDTHREDR